MERLFEKDLENWFLNDSKPLMVIGLRQIGKTYIINKFCESKFKEYIYFNLERDEWVYDLFENTINISEVLEYIEIKLNKKLDLKNTVFFFDEVQISERFITSLKYFCEFSEKVNVICAGSLLGVKINRFNSSFPVGKVTIKYMYPMNFKEFLLALGREKYVELISKHYVSYEKIDDYIHNDLLKLFKLYLLIGGLPESVKSFIDANQNIMDTTSIILQNIKDMYNADMKKYVDNKYDSIKLEKIFNNIPSQLALENKKFKYSEIEIGANKRKYEDIIDWLISAGLVLKSCNVKIPQRPLKVYVDNNFKLFLCDTGLLNTLSEVKKNDILLDDNFMYKGSITENYVAQELAFNGISLYYWTSSATSEIDFLIQNIDGIIPVEVKASNNTKSKSLTSYTNEYKPKYAIRISSKNFGFTNNIKSLPLYAVFCLSEELKDL